MNNNNIINNNQNNLAKIKINKNDESIKIIPKYNLQEKLDNDFKLIKTNQFKNLENNFNQDLKSKFVEKQKISNILNNVNNNIDNISSTSNNNDKSTSARLNIKNSLSKTDTLQKEDSGNENFSGNQTEKNLTNNIVNNSSNDNDLNSVCQQLNIFDDSNIIESNLRLFWDLNKSKFLNRILKGPPDSFRWISWLICSNLPMERSKEYYHNLLKMDICPQINIQIKKDLHRTLSGIKISMKILEDTQLILYNILKAFSIVDIEVAYCQGMNFIVGFLLIISDFNEIDTFYLLVSIFSNTFCNNLGIRGFFIDGFPLLNFYVSIFLILFNKNCPELKKHFENLEIPDEVWISKWFRTLFTLTLPFNICIRIWDCLFIQGLDFLLNFTLAMMKHLEQDLLKKDDLFDVIEYFKKMCPFFSIDNDSDENLLSENMKFMDNFNVEEIISNAKKIKITKTFINQQFEIYQNKNKINLKNLKIKYDIKFNSTYSNKFNICTDCISNKNFPKTGNSENISSNLTNMEKYSSNKKNFYFSANELIINPENELQIIKISEIPLNTNNENNSKINNLVLENSVDFDSSNNSDFDCNMIDIQQKLSNYTFKTKNNLNSMKFQGKID